MKTVYFIKPVGMDGPIKIGCSRSPDKRLETLDVWSPFALEIVAQISGGFDLERRFHACFRVHHQRREWFSADPAILSTIDAINAGTFDISTLPEPASLVARRRTAQTAEGKYSRSVWMRLLALHRRGVEWSECYHDIWQPHSSNLRSYNPALEEKLAAYRLEYPTASDLRRRTAA